MPRQGSAPAQVGAPPTSPSAASHFVWAALALTLAARVIASFAPSAWLWGIATFRYWPRSGEILLIALAAAGFVPPIARGIRVLLERVGGAWEKGGVVADLAISAVIAVPLFFLRDPVRFTGDSLMRLGLLGLPPVAADRLMGYYFPIDYALNVDVPRFLMSEGWRDLTALQFVGALMGGAYAFVSIAALRAAGARGIRLAAGAVIVLGAGTLVHYAGYDKFGPLMLGIALAALGAIRLARTGTGLIALSLGTAIAILSHRSGYFILPASAWCLFQAWRAKREGSSDMPFIAAAAAMLVAAALMIPHTLAVVTSLDLSSHLPGGAVSKSREAAGGPALLTQAAHALNAISFVAPLWLAGLAAALARSRDEAPSAARRSRAEASSKGERRRFSLTPAAWLALAALGALVLTITTGGGWPRDWDCATGLATVITLGTAGLLIRQWRADGAHTAAPAVTLALSASIAFWGVHASETISLNRIDSLLASRSIWSDATRANACDLLGADQMNAGHFDRAAAYFSQAIESAPNPRYFHQLGLAQLSSGRLDDASRNFQIAIERNPIIADPWVGLARVALTRGDTARAMAFNDSALRRSPQNVHARELRALLPR